MCDIGGLTPKQYLEFLLTRASKRRIADNARTRQPDLDPKRPDASARISSTLAYAGTFDGQHRFAGYSGRPSGMTDKPATLSAEAIAGRRIGRLRAIVPNGAFDPTKKGIPIVKDNAGKRLYCNCAELAALSIAISHQHATGNLVFAAFKAPEFQKANEFDVCYEPCPNCSSWLNRFAGAYFTPKTEMDSQIRLAQYTLDTKAFDPKSQNPKFLHRTNSVKFIINPPRSVNDISFSLHEKVFVMRCFRCAG